VLEQLTLDEVRRGELPDDIKRLLDQPDAWNSR
jgi:hypothetical protein